MNALTPNFNWNLPAVGGDGDVWGYSLDSNWTSIDSLMRRSINNFISTTAPTEAQAGTIWLNSTTNPNILGIYDGSTWVTIGTLNTTAHTFAASGVTPYIGDQKFSAQTTNHGSWLLCNGQSLDTTTYSGLFALIAYSFGGSGANFLAPDMRGRVPGAIGTGSGLSARTLGQTVGEETHLLITAEIPAHTHAPTSGNFVVDIGSGGSIGLIGGQNAQDQAVTASTGGGGAHNNMQPTLFVGNYFIYSGV